MKKPTLILSLLLAVLIILSSCNGGESDVTTTPEAVDTTAPDAPPVAITSGGATEYKLIRSEKASSKVTDAFVKLRNTINEKYEVKMEVGDDLVMPGKEAHAYEIAIGSVNRKESAQALTGVGYNNAVIAFIGNRLMITGISDDAVVRAVDLFIEKYLTDGELTVSSAHRVVETAEYAKPGVTIGGVPLTDYVIVYGSSYKDAATEVANRLGVLTGAVIRTQNEKEEPTAHEIAIGAASRFASKIPSERIDDFYITDGEGGDGAAVTPYKVPTLDEAIKVCANRIFIRLDVKEDVNGVIFWEFDRDIWPLLEKYKAYTTVICTWHSAFVSSGYKFTRELKERTEALCGKPILNFHKNGGLGNHVVKEIKNYNLSYAMRLTCNFSEYSYKTFLADNKSRFESFKGVIRVYADVHNTNAAYPENCESEAFYQELYDVGINIQLVNYGYMMCKYIAENFEPTK